MDLRYESNFSLETYSLAFSKSSSEPLTKIEKKSPLSIKKCYLIELSLSSNLHSTKMIANNF